MEIREVGMTLSKLNLESTELLILEVRYEVATEKEGTGCKGCLGSAVYMSCFPRGPFFWSMTT